MNASVPIALVNALTIDVEDYFQVSAFDAHVHRDAWERMPGRIEHNVDQLLQLLDDHRARATFFTLGWVAQRYPRLVRRIVDQGHELASHGYGHRRASELDHAAFSDDIRRARSLLEDIGGTAVIGYRAPSFSIGKRNLWAFDCIAAAGYRYSSSVYPVRHDHYGMPDAPRFPYRVRDGLMELPVTTTRLFGRNLPAGGGGYFRLAPYHLSRWAIARVNRDELRPAIFYFHPWEIDPEQPRIEGIGLKTRLRHYLNLHRTKSRLKRLLSDFQWDRVDRVFDVGAA
jgi:polysaccharide deacetylase family protein (PEP-CTERM system associated)